MLGTVTLGVLTPRTVTLGTVTLGVLTLGSTAVGIVTVGAPAEGTEISTAGGETATGVRGGVGIGIGTGVGGAGPDGWTVTGGELGAEGAGLGVCCAP